MSKNKDLLVVFQNIIQYYSLYPLISILDKSKKIDFDILIFRPDPSNKGYQKIADELDAEVVKEYSDKLIDELQASKNKYKICLSPYPKMTGANYEYLLGYYYGSASSKPHSTFLPEFRKYFHGVILHSSYDADLMSVYCKAYVVPNLRIQKRINKIKNKKKTLLYLPTYGEVSDINKTCCFLEKLKDKYIIISKAHHGTNSLVEEVDKKNLIGSIADEFYGPNVNSTDLFARADLVLSDNSGAIFDAMYLDIPVCVAATNINKKLGDLDTLQSYLVKQGILIHSDLSNFKNFNNALKRTLDKDIVALQNKKSIELFPNREEDGVRYWLEIINDYLNDRVSRDYVKLHDYYINYQESIDLEVSKLKEACNLKDNKIKQQEKKLAEYTDRKLYKISTKLYKILGRLNDE